MAERLRYLVTYDIRDPKRLRKVHSIVIGCGQPLQYSVFICDLSRIEQLNLRIDLLDVIELAEDQVSLFCLGPPGGTIDSQIEHIGRKPTMPEIGPQIW